MNSLHPAPVLGVIGGSGLYDIEGLENVEWREVRSPFGDASDQLLFGSLDGQPMVFLPRHGRGHRLSPSTINYRANIDAMKRAGVTDILSLSAVGSFREDLAPGTFVIVDQFIDRTFARNKSFLGAVWSRTFRWPSRSTLALVNGASVPVIVKEYRSFEAVRTSLWRALNSLPLRNPTSTEVGVAM